MITDELKEKIHNDPDFINSKKYRYSIDRYLKKIPVSPDYMVAHLLGMSEVEVKTVFDGAVLKIRQFMKIEI